MRNADLLGLGLIALAGSWWLTRQPFPSMSRHRAEQITADDAESFSQENGVQFLGITGSVAHKGRPPQGVNDTVWADYDDGWHWFVEVEMQSVVGLFRMVWVIDDNTREFRDPWDITLEGLGLADA
jgi:hypothetical protein